MSKKANKLRAEADALEAAERDEAIVARCRFGGYEWSCNGLCYRLYSEFVPCRGYGGFKHYDSYSDEYGSWRFCSGCNGSGTNFVTHRVRAPEFDAPRPPEEDE